MQHKKSQNNRFSHAQVDICEIITLRPIRQLTICCYQLILSPEWVNHQEHEIWKVSDRCFFAFFSFLPFAMATTATHIYIYPLHTIDLSTFVFKVSDRKKKWFASRLEKKRKKKKTNRPITIVICLFNIALAHTLTSSLRLVICNGNKRQKMSLTTFFGDHLFWHLCCWSTISRNESELALNMLIWTHCLSHDNSNKMRPEISILLTVEEASNSDAQHLSLLVELQNAQTPKQIHRSCRPFSSMF